MPMVVGELAKPVAPQQRASSNPVFSKSSRNAVSGMAPPCQVNQLVTAAKWSAGGGPTST